MNEQIELGLQSYNVLPDGLVVVVFTDSLAFTYVNETVLDQDCIQYNSEVIENLRKYITCYCANVSDQSLVGKKMVFDLADPNGNIVRIV
jgi:hypothetical protein